LDYGWRLSESIMQECKYQTTAFNAGPSAIEALLAKRIDVTYVGHNPTINGYLYQIIMI